MPKAKLRRTGVLGAGQGAEGASSNKQTLVLLRLLLDLLCGWRGGGVRSATARGRRAALIAQ